MSRRGVVRTVLVVTLLCGAVWGGIAWWTRPRVIEAGSVLVFVEGRDVGLGRESHAGLGVVGTLGLVGGRCVGLVDGTGTEDTVVVWPSDTTVSGTGESLAITSLGVTVHLGDQIDAGTDDRTFPEFRGRRPRECGDAGLMDLRLGQ
jgi:hypothetical protein